MEHEGKARMHGNEPEQAGGLSDSDLEQVSGGMGLTVAIVGDDIINTCDQFECLWCHHGKIPGQSGHYCEAQGGERFEGSWFDYTCYWCEHQNTCTITGRKPSTGLR